jgi:adenylosuccinate lyase
MESWRKVEVAACEELPFLLGKGKGPSKADLQAIRKATFTVAAVNERERTTDHDMAAFVDVLAQSANEVGSPGSTRQARAVEPAGGAGQAGGLPAGGAGQAGGLPAGGAGQAGGLPAGGAGQADVADADSAAGPGRWVHFGLTSSDVLDTALALQLKAAGEAIVPGACALVSALVARAREHVDTLCVGRTHGVHAEPTTFGVKLAGFAFEAHRNAQRLEHAFAQAAVGAVSGAVGTYAATSPEFEARVLKRLSLQRESVSTQVVARDRYAELLSAIALAAAGIERLATEVRHLQRTEVRELQEPFRGGQKGSSAMPHKRNPIKSEQLAGLARVLRGNAQAALENVALWHERDISHSSVERVILPDSTTLIDYLQARASALVSDMTVDTQRMRENLDLTYGALFSQRVLLALVEGGMSRDDAYYGVQRAAQQAWDTRTPLRELLLQDPITAALDLDVIFDYGHYVRYAHEIVGRLDEIA